MFHLITFGEQAYRSESEFHLQSRNECLMSYGVKTSTEIRDSRYRHKLLSLAVRSSRCWGALLGQDSHSWASWPVLPCWYRLV